MARTRYDVKEDLRQLAIREAFLRFIFIPDPRVSDLQAEAQNLLLVIADKTAILQKELEAYG